MNYNHMCAVISGTSCNGKKFTESVTFTMLPPSKEEPHYGTGYYMRVETPHDTKLIDVRYERTTDVEILADMWIEGWYGENAEDIAKFF